MGVRFRDFSRFGGMLLLGMLLVSCGTYRPDSDNPYKTDGKAASRQSVAVLGVVSSEASLRDFRRKILAHSLEAQVREQQPALAILPYNQLQSALEEQGLHQMLLNSYRMNGELNGEDWRLLRGSGMRVRYLLVARIEGDSTSKMEPARSLVRNNRGEILSDRREVALMHQRVVEISAKTYNVQTGAIVWSGTFASKPINKRVYTEYTGSSFTGSVATLLTNSFVNGRLSTKYPPAPSSSAATQEAFKRIAQKMRGKS